MLGHNSITFSPDKIAIGRELAGMLLAQARSRAGSLFYCYYSSFSPDKIANGQELAGMLWT